jgi:hypothetical protein
MQDNNLKRTLYYTVKPILPRSLQIVLRRHFVKRVLQKVSTRWPVDPRSGGRPPGWRGWPSERRFAFVLTHDVEGSRGVKRCLRLAKLETELGFISSFNFVPERYRLAPQVRDALVKKGFEVGVHDLRHDGKLFQSHKIFLEQVAIINDYLSEWGAVGFRSGSMYHNLEWMHNMKVEYDSSTFDTDPFEPQPDGVATIFPIWVANPAGDGGYIELPYTLPQDFTLFILLEHRDARTWKEKVDWIAEQGGMVLLNSHPDYMHWSDEKSRIEEYPFEIYREFLDHVQRKYRGQYWNALPRDVARCWKGRMAGSKRHE